MKKNWVAVLGVLCSLSLFIGCHHKDYIVDLGSVSFVLNSGDSRIAEQGSAIVSIKNPQGTLIYENQKLALSSSSQGYSTETLQLAVGNFTLASFAIVDPNNNIIYTSSAPMDFTISSAANTQVVPAVLAVGDPVTINLNVIVKFLVGKYLYEDNEATIIARGFDVANNEKWNSEFHFVGPNVNKFPIVAGYDHYTISLQKWGVTDSQGITAQQLWTDRADGNHPVTYGLGGKVPVVKKPAIVYTYADGQSYGSRTEYEYSDDGKVQKITFFDNYTTNAVPSRYQVFTYSDNTLLKVTTYDASSDAKTAEDTYEYGVENAILRISEANYSAALTATVDLSVDYVSQQTTAEYQYSNGRSFEYSYLTSWKNIASSKEAIGSELCNTGNFTYDRNINPFKHLNYTSFLVSNGVSINNTLTEDVNYIACAFPTVIPISYDYKYDDMGYPTEKVTHYVASGDNGKTATSTTTYTYREFQQ